MKFQKVSGTNDYKIQKDERNKFFPREEKQDEEKTEMETDELDEINKILNELQEK